MADMVVIKDLGQDILLGEPAKADNDIITFPSEKLVRLRNDGGISFKITIFVVVVHLVNIMHLYQSLLW